MYNKLFSVLYFFIVGVLVVFPVYNLYTRGKLGLIDALDIITVAYMVWSYIKTQSPNEVQLTNRE